MRFMIVGFFVILAALAVAAEKPFTIETEDRDRYVIVEIDGCQYIKCGRYSDNITHKGNCKHCLKRQREYFEHTIKAIKE